MYFIPPIICMIGVNFSIYEMTMNLKGHNAYKRISCTNQKVMDYRHTLFVRKDTHIKYLCAMILCQFSLAKRLSPLDDIVMDLLDTVEGKNHQCVMYNIYNSSTYFKAAYNHEKNY